MVRVGRRGDRVRQAATISAPPSTDNAKQIVNDALLSQVMDVWVQVQVLSHEYWQVVL